MRRTLTALSLALAASVGGLAVGVPQAAAVTGYTETARTVYTLEPAHDRLSVSVTIKVKNTTRDSTEAYSCVKYSYDYFWGYLPYTTTCYRTTTWYMTSTSAWVENEAVNLRAKSGGQGLSISTGSQGSYYRLATITFPKLYYGKSRTVTLTYTVPGGAPRSASGTRTLRAYAKFCAVANGMDSGTVTVNVPTGYTFETSGETVRSKVAGKERVYTSGTIANTGSWYACFDGINEAGYATDTLTAPGGRKISLRSWPEDPDWVAGVRSEVNSGLPNLVELIGTAMSGTAPLVIQEAATGNEYAGFYDSASNTVTVGEDFRQPSLVQHELAHVWFNKTAFSETWLDEGFAEWAGRTTGGEQSACTAPEAAPASIVLADWKYLTPRSSTDERQAVTNQYDAACWIITAVADAAGRDRMTTAVQGLLARRDPYAADPAVTRVAKVATWKDWLDAVEELA
ncbi:MAG: hypothetical protein WCK58_14925, partial [Chloroflexota bacterium]